MESESCRPQAGESSVMGSAAVESGMGSAAEEQTDYGRRGVVRLGAFQEQEREEQGGQSPQYAQCTPYSPYTPYRQVKVVETSRSRSCVQCGISRDACDNEWPCHVCIAKGLRCVQLRSGDDHNAFAQYGNTSSCPIHCRCISTHTRAINQ